MTTYNHKNSNASFPYLLGNGSSALDIGLSGSLHGLGGVLGGLDRHDNALSLAVDAHSLLLADSHVLGAIRQSISSTSYE